MRVHPEMARAPAGCRRRQPDKKFWEERYEDINAFERHLDRNGTKIVKFFLHVSKEEQRQRFLERLDDPEKHWKFSAADVAERGTGTSTWRPTRTRSARRRPSGPPGTSFPPTTSGSRALLVADALVDAIQGLDLRWPEVSEEERRANEEARRLLEAET